MDTAFCLLTDEQWSLVVVA